MQAIFVTARGTTCRRQWALDADLAAAFDQIDHAQLLDQLGWFPARGMIAAWLTAGVIDRGRFAPTERGCPQGGVISPVLMNVALHGMEQAAGVRYIPTGPNAGTARPGSPVVVRYADDLLALCHSREQAEQVKARLAAWLAPRGLVFNEDKTRIVHLDDGVDFLGFNVRRYRGKLLIKPSKAAVKRIRARLTAEMRALRGHNAQMVLIRFNPIIRGWSAYYRHAVSARVFNELDHHVWKLTYKWAKFTHPHKSKHWIITRYFGAFNSTRRDRWVFGDRDNGAYLLKFAWTKITRHTLVKGWASPDDPTLVGYWAARRRRGRPPLDQARLRLLHKQCGRCPLCGDLLLHADQEPQHPDEWEQWITATRKAIRHQAITLDTEPGNPDQLTVFRLIHTHCRDRLPDGFGSRPALLPAHEPKGLLEPVAWKAGTAGSEGTPGAATRLGLPDEAQFGPLRTFAMGNSNHPNHTVQTRKLQAYLRWRNTHARRPDVGPNNAANEPASAANANNAGADPTRKPPESDPANVHCQQLLAKSTLATPQRE
jgi:RNA-directed DNA polymerase